MTLNRFVCACLVCFAACRPDPGPGPKPPGPDSGTGGMVATGGTEATGGDVATGGEVSTGGTTGVPITNHEAVACANVAKFCPPKTQAACLAEVARIEYASKYASIKLDCLIKATSQAAVQDCKSVVCGSVR